MDTALALQALAATQTTNGASAAAAFLLSTQQANGAWLDNGGEPSVFISAHAARALWHYRNTYQGVSTALTSARTFLLSQRGANGLWAENFNTALSLIALIPALPDLSSVSNSIAALQSAQLPNGSWDNDPYTTALALQALYLAGLPQTNPDYATIKGQVVDAQTGLPLSGVTVAMSGAAAASVTTASDGVFVFGNLPAGSFSLQISLAGYSTLSTSTSTQIGQTVDLGTLLLSKVSGTTTGTVQGTVTDASSGAPLPGVSVTASGVASAAMTDTTGRYQIVNVPAGSVTVTASKVGYVTASSSGTLTAGGILIFSPALAPGASPGASVRGTVTSATTGQPLSGVLMTVSGASSASATTDSSGNYQIGGLNPGTITLTASLSGYDPVSAGASVFAGATITFSPKLYPAGQTPPGANTTSLTGVVLDAATHQPLSGVTATLSGAVSAIQTTAADGRFLFQSLPAGSYTLVLTLANYGTISTSLTLALGQTLDLGTLLMIKTAGATTGTIEGTVTDAATGQPLAGVSITVSVMVTTALTDTAGRYQIVNVPAGNVSMTAGKTGYTPASGSGTLSAGGVLVFSPALAPETSPAGGAIQGTVRRAADNAPLAGVSIQVSGALSAQATTDAAGSYRLPTGSASGPVTLAATLAGYDPVSAGSILLANSTITFSPKLYPTGQTPPGANAASITGVVMDAGTNQPLAGVAITARYGTTTKTLASDAQGRFTVTGIATAEAVLTFSLSGYVPATLDVLVEPLETQDIGQVRLRKEKAAQLLPDLTVKSVSRTGAVTDPQTLAVSGALGVEVVNIGNANAPASIALLAFYDANRNGLYDSGDTTLGQATTTASIPADGLLALSIPVQGALPFRDAPISVWTDSGQGVVELNETNNIKSTASGCEFNPPPVGTFQPVLKWHWSGSPVLPAYNQVMMAPAVAQTNDDNGDGKIDRNDIPDVIFVAYGGAGADFGAGVLRAVSGKDGTDLFAVTNLAYQLTSYANIAVGDIDGDGLIEIVGPKFGGGLIAFEHDGTFKWQINLPTGWNVGGPSIADLDGDGRAEIVFGRYAVNGDGTLRWSGSGGFTIGGSHPNGSLSTVADIDNDGRPEVIVGASVYDADGRLRWVNRLIGDGFTAVGDFNGDAYAEIVMVGSGSVSLYDHRGNLLWGSVLIPGGGRGGPPTIADVDGDGEPDIGVAGYSRYVVFNADGSIKWSSITQDFSSNATGSSVFDFDGDGSAEVVYGDEYNLRVYKGTTGVTVFSIPNSSGTAFELPVIADIDNDNHADLIVVSNRYYPSTPGSTVGIRVFQDQNNSWVNTRKIWNQHSYHINNINDDGTVPRQETPSWQTHNTYRLNAFLDRSATGVPDLTAGLFRIIENGTGQPVSLSVRVGNAGVVTSPNAVRLSFHQGDPSGAGVLLAATALSPLAAGEYRDLQVNGVTIPGTADLHAVVDADNKVSECNEANNRVQTPVAASAPKGEIAVSTDAPAYGPNTPAQLKATVSNTGALAASFSAALRVDDSSGNVVAQFPARAVGPLAGGASFAFTDAWNTGTTLAGNYRLHGLLYDTAGVLVHEALAAFAIQAPAGAPAVTLRLSTDRATYHTTDTVNIRSLASNVTTNTIINSAVLRLSVKNPSGQVILTKDVTLGQLLPGALLDLLLPYALSSAAEGVYAIDGKVLDAAQNTLATATASIEVKSDPTKALTGRVQTALSTLEVGQTQSCTDTLTNGGNVALNNLEVHHVLVSLDTQLLISEKVVAVGLAAGAQNSDTRSLATAGLLPGHYACVLQVRLGGSLTTLANGAFTLTAPPVSVQAELRLGTKGRLLVLLDGVKGGGSNADSDPHGPSGAPTLTAQRTFLTKLLTDAGWSYTITENEKDFTREFHSGGYRLYALFAEQEKLAETTQKELREAVFRGEGLLIAGPHDNRHQKVNDALGVKLIGNVSQAVGADLLQSFGLSGALDLIPKDKALRVKRLSAEARAVYRLGAKPSAVSELRSSDDEEDCEELASSSARGLRSPDSTDECEGHPENFLDAITANTYGQGRSLLAGFDLLATATRDGPASLAAQVLLAALDAANPETLSTGPAAVAPVELALINKGIATTVKATLPLPAGVEVVDRGTAQLLAPATLQWNLALAIGETRTLKFWLRLPAAAATVSLVATVDAGSFHTDTVALAFSVTGPQTLAQLQARLDALIAAAHPDAKALKQAAQDLKQAISQAKLDKAIQEVLKATDALLGLARPEIVSIRVGLDEWLRWAGQRAY